MAVKNLQSVVCNVATQCGNVTNLDSKGYGMAMYQPPAMSSPQYPVLSEPTQPGLRHERGTIVPRFRPRNDPDRWHAGRGLGLLAGPS